MKTLIYLDCQERAHFFKKVALALDEEVIFVTNRLSVYWIMRDFDVRLIKKSQDPLEILDDSVLQNTLSVVGKYHSLEVARAISANVARNIANIVKTESIDLCLIWNGSTTIAKTIAKCADNFGIKTLFFELSNLPNKLFYDGLGVNAASRIFFQPEILDDFLVDDVVFEEWKKEYFKLQSIPKQAANKHTIRMIAILDYIGFCFGVVQEDFRNPLAIIKRKLQNKSVIVYEKKELSCEYIFFPLQVSNDTQIMLHSDVDNLMVLRLLKEKYPNTIIYAKIHPAEENREFIHQVIQYAKEQGIFIVGNDTKELIQHALKVAVINSTVGLEAMIYNKKIEVFGRAVYSHFDYQRLKKYICGYLANMEYFGEDPINKDEFKRIVSCSFPS